MIAFDIWMSLEDEGVTSFDIAATEANTEAMAGARLPDFITFYVALLEDTGPRAFTAIFSRYGSIPVLFLTGDAEDCVPVNPPAVVPTKLFAARQVGMTYRTLVEGGSFGAEPFAPNITP